MQTTSPNGKETITAAMSRWAAGLRFEQLSCEAVHQAKRLLLDSLGCALGGYLQHDVKIALAVLDEIAGDGPATVIGSGKHVDAVSASLANALMIRCMDYNDIYWKQDPSHPSDIFPAALACCERARSNARELIVGLVLGHEFEMRLCEAAFPGIRERGWHHATLTAFVAPIVAGRALHLTWEQIQQVRSAHKGNCGPFAALRDRRRACRPAGHSGAIHHGQDYGSQDPRTTSESRSGRRSRD